MHSRSKRASLVAVLGLVGLPLVLDACRARPDEKSLRSAGEASATSPPSLADAVASEHAAIALPPPIRDVNASCEVDTQCRSRACRAAVCQPPALQLVAASAAGKASPIGYVDGLRGPTILGWAYDPNAASSSIQVHVYRGSGFANFVGAVVADAPRPDVNDALKISGNHGYAFTVPEPAAFAGEAYYAYAVSATGAPSSLLVNSPVTFGIQASIDQAVGNRINGWVLDPASPSSSAEIHVYADAAFKTFLGSVRADRSRPDVNGYFGITGDHGFSFQVPDGYGGSDQKLYFYALPVKGGTTGIVQLPGSPVTIGTVAGYVDDVRDQTVSGWAFHPFAPATTLRINVFADDGTLVATTTADRPRPDVNQFFSIPGDHGYAVKIPPEQIKSERKYHVHAVVTPNGPDPQLTRSPVKFESYQPEARLTVNGQSGLIQGAVGQTLAFAWSSTRGTAWTSGAYVDTSAMPQAWVANTSAGSTTRTVTAADAGRTLTFVYEVVSQAGLRAVASVRVAVAPAGPPPPDESRRSLVGVNLGGATDYAAEAFYADLMRTARAPYPVRAGDPPVGVDADGWPTSSSFNLYLWSGGVGNCQPGTYAVSFNGRAASLVAPRFSNTTYDAATNTTTSTLTVSEAQTGSNFWLTFTGAYRDAAGTQPGITNIRIMRPDPDTGVPYPPTTMFHRPILALLRKFDVVRYFEFTNVMGLEHREWAERRLPTYRVLYPATPGRPTEPAWEDVVHLANLSGTDAWINLPINASDDYARKLAQLFAFGSDGATGLPYTGPFGSPYDAAKNPRPAPHAENTWVEGTTAWYPPLKSNLKIYVELSNELWIPNGNPYWRGYWGIEDQRKASPITGPCRYGPLDADKRSQNCEHAAYVVKRTAQISLVFRRVYGDAAMMTRIRPFLPGHAAWTGGPGGLGNMFSWGFDYLSNGEGHNLISSEWVVPGTGDVVPAQPLSYYFYGAGGTAYYAPSDKTSVESLLTSGHMDVSRWGPLVGAQQDMYYPAVYGVQRVAYEAGPVFQNAGPLAAQAVMTGPPAVPNLRDVVIAHHDAWSSWGGGLHLYYKTSTLDFGLLPVDDAHRQGDIYSAVSAPKLAAIETIAARPKPAVAQMQFGTESPAVDFVTIPGGWGTTNYIGAFGSAFRMYYDSPDGSVYLDQKAVTNRGKDVDAYPGYYFTDTEESYKSGIYSYTGYVFGKNTDKGAVRVRVKLAEVVVDSRVEVFFDGVSLGIQSARNGALEFAAGEAGPGLHGVIVRSAAGKFKLMTVQAY
jgi:hypothetical protein